MNIQLKTIFGDLILEGDFTCLADCVKAAIAAKKSLSSADLRSANLRSADLSSANLSYADLSSANLRYANLSYADLSSANLRYANLSSANLSSANLRYANLSVIKNDFLAVLCSSPSEVVGLRKAIIEGRINGSTYEGDCACLVGTIANVRHVKYSEIPGLTPDGARPAERFFLCINKGDTPETNQASKLALGWLDEWYANITAAFPAAT